MGVNIEDVIGTGVDGSITRQDVEAYATKKGSGAPVSAPRQQ